jgi:hypothetical protein
MSRDARRHTARAALAAVAGLALPGIEAANATEPCGAFDECRAIVEINATDGDIGFQWLADAEGLVGTELRDPSGRLLFANVARGALRQQTLTETFGESAEPVCRRRLAEDPDEDVVTLAQFVRRWAAGLYRFRGLDVEGGTLAGRSPLTHWLPAAPRNLAFSRGVITWDAGVALGECATRDELWKLVADGVLPIHPMNVPVAAWEVVLELEDDSGRSFSIRLPARGANAQMSVTVPPEFLFSVAPDTPAKIEVGAIGGRLEIGDDDNATFSEVGGLCLNRRNGCADED